MCMRWGEGWGRPALRSAQLASLPSVCARGERMPISHAPLGRANSIDTIGRPGAMPPADMPRPRWGEQSQTHLKNVQIPRALSQPFDKLRGDPGPSTYL
jgi:hypothetical protein